MKKIISLVLAAVLVSLVSVSTALAQNNVIVKAEAPKAENQNAKVTVVSPTVINSGVSGGITADGKIAVYRKTLCGKLRFIGCICPSEICGEIPGPGYVLVKKHCGSYYWVEICSKPAPKPCGC